MQANQLAIRWQNLRNIPLKITASTKAWETLAPLGMNHFSPRYPITLLTRLSPGLICGDHVPWNSTQLFCRIQLRSRFPHSFSLIPHMTVQTVLGLISYLHHCSRPHLGDLVSSVWCSEAGNDSLGSLKKFLFASQLHSDPCVLLWWYAKNRFAFSPPDFLSSTSHLKKQAGSDSKNRHVKSGCW